MLSFHGERGLKDHSLLSCGKVGRLELGLKVPMRARNSARIFNNEGHGWRPPLVNRARVRTTQDAGKFERINWPAGKVGGGRKWFCELARDLAQIPVVTGGDLTDYHPNT